MDRQIKTAFKVMIALALASSFAACAVKKAEKAGLSGDKKAVNGQPVEDKTKADGGACLGGQPGVIEVQGAVSQGADGKAVLDTRLKITQNAGRSEAGEPAEITLNGQAKVKAVPDKIDMADVVADRTYINLGCASLGEAVTGLTEQKIAGDKGIAVSKANRIFICGHYELPAGMVTLKADAIFLQEAAVTMTANHPNTLLIQANSIGVKGHNTIESKGLSSMTANADVPASLNLVVAKEMQGADGNLEIISAGGDCGKELDIMTEGMPVSPN